ncbi:MAG: DMT family transporter, partial [Deltaproteobacteria bacterium]|nr:DMT family transporter [Deltaproteobacteria bacterium]
MLMETPPGSDAGPTWSRGAALIVGATFAFALMAIFSRSADAPVLAVAAWRAVIVAVVFGGWALWDGGLSSLKPDASTLRTGVPYGLALALASSTFVGGYALTTVANTVFLHSLAPLFVFPLAAWAFGERASPRALLGTGVAVLGVALLSGVSIFHVSRYTDTRFLLGDFLALLSAAGYGAVLVGTRAARRTEAPMVPTLFVAWSVAAVVLCALALVMGQLAIPLRALGWVLALAIVSTNVPFFLLTLGMRSVGAGLASLLAMAEVVFATALGVVVYGESLAPIGWVGAVLVVVGIAQPFLREPAATADGDLVPASRRARLLRLGLRLLVLNAGAGLALVGGAESGVLLAWAAIASALHLGPPLMDRAGWVARLAPGGLALVVMIGLALRGGWTDPDPPWAVVVTAVLAWGADRWLARREDPAEVDLDSLGSAALLLVASGALLARSGHAGGPLLLLLAAIS